MLRAMSHEPNDDDELRAMSASKASPRMLIRAAIAGAIVAVVLALASYYAAERDRRAHPSEASETR